MIIIFWIKVIVWLSLFISGSAFLGVFFEIDESRKIKQEMIIGFLCFLLFFSILLSLATKRYEGFEYEAKLYDTNSIVKEK